MGPGDVTGKYTVKKSVTSLGLILVSDACIAAVSCCYVTWVVQ
jgi:hypothetical protein